MGFAINSTEFHLQNIADVYAILKNIGRLQTKPALVLFLLETYPRRVHIAQANYIGLMVRMTVDN